MNNQDLSADLIEALVRFEVKYPGLIRRLRENELMIDIDLYLEELAMECAQALLDSGITAIHRLDQPCTISIQLPSLFIQNKTHQAIQVLEEFLKAHSYKVSRF